MQGLPVEVLNEELYKGLVPHLSQGIEVPG